MALTMGLRIAAFLSHPSLWIDVSHSGGSTRKTAKGDVFWRRDAFRYFFDQDFFRWKRRPVLSLWRKWAQAIDPCDHRLKRVFVRARRHAGRVPVADRSLLRSLVFLIWIQS